MKFFLAERSYFSDSQCMYVIFCIPIVLQPLGNLKKMQTFLAREIIWTHSMLNVPGFNASVLCLSGQIYLIWSLCCATAAGSSQEIWWVPITLNQIISSADTLYSAKVYHVRFAVAEKPFHSPSCHFEGCCQQKKQVNALCSYTFYNIGSCWVYIIPLAV